MLYACTCEIMQEPCTAARGSSTRPHTYGVVARKLLMGTWDFIVAKAKKNIPPQRYD